MAKLNYPRGVIALSSVEMWERFSFYTMQSLLVLYASAKIVSGGLGWSDADALRLVGYYGALVYVSPVIGGVIADKVIGRKWAVLSGSFIMMCGHAALAFPGEKAMYLGLALLITGCGLMKPAISAMVGEFFKNSETSRKDASFAIFYMSINIGGFLGPMVGGVVQVEYGFEYAFAMAAVGLFIGIINFLMSKNKSLKDVGNLIHRDERSKDPWTATEKKKLAVYLMLCVTNIFWNVIYVLPYGLLTLYAEKNIDRHVGGFLIPSTWYYAMYGLLIIIYSPIVATMYQSFKNKTGNDMTLSWKLAIGYLLVAGGSLILLPLVHQIALNPHYLGSSGYIIGFYTLFSFSELLTLPVMLAAATTFAPKGFSATLVSLNMAISWAIGAWLGGEFGALTQEMNPVILFWWVIGLCVVFAIGHVLSDRKIERIMQS